MSEHARLSLSHSDLWLGCSAWPRIVEGLGEEMSPEIQFGNDSHEILEQMLTGMYTPNDSYPEETECAKVAMDYLQSQWVAMGLDDTVCLAEAEVKITSTNRTDLWGAADAILYNDSVLEVVDLKTGVGTYVDEQTSGQMMHYAIAALETFGLVRGKNQPSTIRLTIVQPRYWGDEPKIRTRTVTPDELYTWLAMIANPAAEATDVLNAEGTASVRCKKCAGRHVCEYRDKAVGNALVGGTDEKVGVSTTMLITERDIRKSQDATIYDNSRLSEVLMLVPVIRDYCDALEEHALEIITKGEQVSGFKVVASGGRSKWRDEEAVAEALHKTKVAKNAFKHVLKTPRQVLALGPSTGLKKKLEDLIIKSEGGRVLVMDSDKRESVVPAFEVVNQQALPPILQEQNPVESPAAIPDFLL